MTKRMDTSYQTMQTDFWNSGLAAEIGLNAVGVWMSIKAHADYENGLSWPGMRRLAEMTGLGLGTVSRAVSLLERHKLLRVVKKAKGSFSKRGSTYVARERIQVTLGSRVLCSVYVDYVPHGFHKRLKLIQDGLIEGPKSKSIFAECEIVPGEGLSWDPERGALVGNIPGEEVSRAMDPEREPLSERRLGDVLKAARRKLK